MKPFDLRKKALLKVRLQSEGVRADLAAWARGAGAGPSAGGVLVIDGMQVNVPITAAFTADSPYRLRREDTVWQLYLPGSETVEAMPVRSPQFYTLQTADGIPYWKIALRHGQDSLATTVVQTCKHWRTGRQCRFCAIERSLERGDTIARKTPEQLAEVAQAAEELDGLRHFTLTSGAFGNGDEGISYLAECVKAIKSSTTMRVHVQFAPPAQLDEMTRLAEAGTDSVGIHIESFDPNVLSRVAPVKAEKGLAAYLRAMERAVELFGRNQVSSFIIVGLGEDDASVVGGARRLAEMSVYPWVVPFRPLPGTPMADVVPPSAARMQKLYSEVAKIVTSFGLAATRTLGGCVRCGACSALPEFEVLTTAEEDIQCRVAQSAEEVSASLEIRQRVFVEEQQLFEKSDIDSHDLHAVHILLLKAGRIVGSVRVHEESDGVWQGSRLVVLPEHRSGWAGVMLVREAVNYVRERGARRFWAMIQADKEKFFRRLGWRSETLPVDYLGVPHVVMVASLNSMHQNHSHGDTELILEKANAKCKITLR